MLKVEISKDSFVRLLGLILIAFALLFVGTGGFQNAQKASLYDAYEPIIKKLNSNDSICFDFPNVSSCRLPFLSVQCLGSAGGFDYNWSYSNFSN